MSQLSILDPLILEHFPPSPELLTGGEITPPHLTLHYGPPSPSAVDPTQATTVAQEVSLLLLSLFDKRFDVLQASINSALAQITSNAQKITELENMVSTCEDTVTALSQSTTTHQTELSSLRDKLDDLENRERRNNLRFVGVPETITGEHLNSFLTKDFLQALDLTIPSNPLLVERVHRIGPPRNQGGGRPRQVIAKFQNWTIKEQILRAYR